MTKFSQMYQVLRDYIEAKTPISDQEFEIVKTYFIPKKLRRKQYLLQEGEICKQTAFVTKGALRMYRVDEKGDEHILQFGLENWWVSDRESVYSGEPSKYNIDALEDSEVLMIDNVKIEELKSKVGSMQKLFDVMNQNNFIAAQKRIHSAISKSAEERYHEFMTAYPQIIQRVPQHMIASYLGIKAETLSRIRKSWAKY